MKLEEILQLPPPDEWNQVKNGSIKIPDVFDNLTNSIGMQFGFHKISGLSEGEAIGNIIASIQKFVSKIEPIDLLLFCPNCNYQHIDEAEPDVCEACGFGKEKCTCPAFTAWLNPPHKSHRCSNCNHVWRPSDVPTNGVREIKTKGENDGDFHPKSVKENK